MLRADSHGIDLSLALFKAFISNLEEAKTLSEESSQVTAWERRA